MKKILGQDCYEVKDVAEQLSVSPLTVKKYLKDGKLKGRKIGRSWVVSEDDLKEFARIGCK